MKKIPTRRDYFGRIAKILKTILKLASETKLALSNNDSPTSTQGKDSLQ